MEKIEYTGKDPDRIKEQEYTGWTKAQTTTVKVSVANLQRIMYAMSNAAIALTMETDKEIIEQVVMATKNEMATLERIFVGIYNNIDVDADTEYTEIIEDSIETIQMTKDLTEEWMDNNK